MKFCVAINLYLDYIIPKCGHNYDYEPDDKINKTLRGIIFDYESKKLSNCVRNYCINISKNPNIDFDDDISCRFTFSYDRLTHNPKYNLFFKCYIRNFSVIFGSINMDIFKYGFVPTEPLSEFKCNSNFILNESIPGFTKYLESLICNDLIIV